MLEEAVRMRRLPGILFADGPSGRRARIAGTGIDVFEVVRSFQQLESNFDRLKESYHWLSELQLRVALAYAATYPGEIEERISLEQSWSTSEAVHQAYPFTRCATT